MGIAEDFQAFLSELAISDRSTISARYRRITNRLNKDFWGYDSEVNNSLYVGSYGRDTAISGFSDLDMIFELPAALYYKFDKYTVNGQSALLQEVRNSLQKTYPSSRIGADGQIVEIAFNDQITFEIVPAFLTKDNTYIYPDTNGGGKWKTTDPKTEIFAINELDKQVNSNLKRLCKMARSWKHQWNVPIGGLLIDTLAYKFIKGWEYRFKSYYYYDFLARDFFKFLADQNSSQSYWHAVGSNQIVLRKGNFEYSAKRCYNIACEAIASSSYGYQYTANQKWREIYGTRFPA